MITPLEQEDMIPPVPPQDAPKPADAAPVVEAPKPEDNAKTSKLLNNLLGLVAPEEKDVTPKVEEPKPVEPAPAPAKKVAVKPRPAAPAPVAPAPQPPVQEIVDTAVKSALAAQKPAPPAPVEEDLSPEELEELDLVTYAESKDPSKKGLADKFRKFYVEQKKFLEKALAEDPDYDPESDPKFKKFLEQNEPKLPSSERKKFVTDRISEKAAEEGYKRAKSELTPEIEKTQRKLREMEERPKVQQRLSDYVNEVASGMPPEIVEFYEKNDQDVAKLQEAYPLEFEIISASVSKAMSQAQEFLNVRRGIVDFDPVANPAHKEINEFVAQQGEVFAQRGGQARFRDGKEFIPPHKWRAGMEKTHWTFGDEDVLHMIKVNAQSTAKVKISAEQQRIEKAVAARTKRSSGAVTPPAPVSDNQSPKVVAPPAPGPASSGQSTPVSSVANLLGL